MNPSGPSDVEEALRSAARDDGPRILSILASKFGDLDLADDAVQDALLDATRTWPDRGIPDNPGGWLMTTARRRALDHLRSETRQATNLRDSAAEIYEQSEAADPRDPTMITPTTDYPRRDERLGLILLCCHPALSRDAQVALTLRLVGGLATPEISRAFLVPESTLAQRIVRAKRKIRTAKIGMAIPKELGDRLDVVLSILYLIFNEGYLSSRPDGATTRVDLIDEAIRLTRLVVELAPHSPEATGLLALELFHSARTGARTNELDDLVLLDDQDRSAWDTSRISEANSILAETLERMEPGPYQLQAVIAGTHANSKSAAHTDWTLIAALYAQLEAMSASPVVGLNRAVAIAMADGPLAGLRIIDQLTGLDDYHLYWASKGELHRRAGHWDEAHGSLSRALSLATSEAERRHLANRLAELDQYG